MVVKEEREAVTAVNDVSEEPTESIAKYTKDWHHEISAMTTESESECDKYEVTGVPTLNSPGDGEGDYAEARFEDGERQDTNDTRGSELNADQGDEAREDTETPRQGAVEEEEDDWCSQAEKHDATAGVDGTDCSKPEHVAQVDYMAFGEDAIIERKTLNVPKEENVLEGDSCGHEDMRGAGSKLDDSRCDPDLQVDASEEVETRGTCTGEETLSTNSIVDLRSSVGVMNSYSFCRDSPAPTPRSMLCDLDFRREDLLLKLSPESSMVTAESTSTGIYQYISDYPSDELFENNAIEPWSPKAMFCGTAESSECFDAEPLHINTSSELDKELQNANDSEVPFSVNKVPQQDVILPTRQKPIVGMELGEEMWKGATIEATSREPIATPKSAFESLYSATSDFFLMSSSHPKSGVTAFSNLDQQASDCSTTTASVDLAEELRKRSRDDAPFSLRTALPQDAILPPDKKPIAGMDLARQVWKAATAEASVRDRALCPKSAAESMREVAADIFLVSSTGQKAKVPVEIATQFDEPATMDGIKQVLSKRPLSPISLSSPRRSTRKSNVQEAIKDLFFVGTASKLERIEGSLFRETGVRGSEKISNASPRGFESTKSKGGNEHPFDEEKSLRLDANRIVQESIVQNDNDLVDASGNVFVVPVSKNTTALHQVLVAGGTATKDDQVPCCGTWQLEEIRELAKDIWGSMRRFKQKRSDEDEKERYDEGRALASTKGALRSTQRSYSTQKFSRDTDLKSAGQEMSLLPHIKDPAIETGDVRVIGAVSPASKSDISVPFDERNLVMEDVIDDRGIELISFEAGMFTFVHIRVNPEFELKIPRGLFLQSPAHSPQGLVLSSMLLPPLYLVLEVFVSVHKAKACENVPQQPESCRSVKHVKEWIDRTTESLREMCTTQKVAEQVEVSEESLRFDVFKRPNNEFMHAELNSHAAQEGIRERDTAYESEVQDADVSPEMNVGVQVSSAEELRVTSKSAIADGDDESSESITPLESQDETATTGHTETSILDSTTCCRNNAKVSHEAPTSTKSEGMHDDKDTTSSQGSQEPTVVTNSNTDGISSCGFEVNEEGILPLL